MEGRPADGNVLIAKDVTGPEGETLLPGEDLCTGENGANVVYGEDAILVAQALKLDIGPAGALAASTIDLPLGSVAGPGNVKVPTDTKLTQDIVDDPAADIYVSGAILGSRLNLDVGGGHMESTTLPQVSYQSPASLVGWFESQAAVQRFRPPLECPPLGIVLTGFVEAPAAIPCDTILNNAVLFGSGASLHIPRLALSSGHASIGSVHVGGRLTIGGPTDLLTEGLSHYDGGTDEVAPLGPDYSQPVIILDPLNSTTTAPFDYGGMALDASGPVTLGG